MKLLLSVSGGLAAVVLLGALATWLITRHIEARHPPIGRFVDVEGGRLHYVEAGPSDRAPQATIVFLHGASSSQADAMLALGNRLSDRYRVISFDRPGHGWSERIAGPAAAAPAWQAKIIRDGLARLQVKGAIVVAHSWAGAILPNLALDHSDVVAGTVYLAPVTHPWPGGGIAWYYDPAASSWFGWLMTRTITTPVGLMMLEPLARAVFSPQEPPPDYIEKARVALAVRPSVFRANAQDVAGLYAAVAAQEGRYRNIRVPTTIIAGDADNIVWTDVHSRGLARAVPSARLVILRGVGHMPHHAAPDLVIDEIERLAAAPVTSE